MGKVLLVCARGLQATAEEWLRVSMLPEEELPRLSEHEAECARFRHVTPVQYQRHLELRRLAAKREEHEGEVLGAHIQDILDIYFGAGYRLVKLSKAGFQRGWVAEIADFGKTGPRQIEVPIDGSVLGRASADVVDYFTAALGTQQVMERKAG